jgi:hypothetical protein
VTAREGATMVSVSNNQAEFWQFNVTACEMRTEIVISSPGFIVLSI